MLSVILTLLFLSLAGIIFMIGNKLILIQEGKAVTQEQFPIQIPNPQELKHAVSKKTRRYGFIALVIILRLYVKISHFLKIQWKKFSQILITKINKIINKKRLEEPKEVSVFLKRISAYKKRVKRIKDKIKEEEGIE